jgi:hypothetical protein
LPVILAPQRVDRGKVAKNVWKMNDAEQAQNTSRVLYRGRDQRALAANCRRALVLVMAATAILALAAGPVLASGWLPSQPAATITEPELPAGPVSDAVNQAGVEAVGWTTTSGSAILSIRRPGATLTPRTIEPSSADAFAVGYSVHTAIDQAGDVLEVWQERHGEKSPYEYSVDYAILAPDGSLIGPQAVPGTLNSQQKGSIGVQALPSGQSLISWDEVGDNSIDYVRVTGSALSETRAISTELPPAVWVFKETSSGVLTAAWSEDSEQEEAGERVGTGFLRTSRIQADGVESSPQTLEQTSIRCPNTASQCSTFLFDLQLNSDLADTTLTWVMSMVEVAAKDHVLHTVKSSDATGEGPFAAPQSLITREDQSTEQASAVLSDGTLVVCWSEEVSDPKGAIQCRWRPPGSGSFSTAQTVVAASGEATVELTQLIPAGSGAYVLYGGIDQPPMTQKLGDAGPAGPAFSLSGDSHETQVPVGAEDGADDGLAAWWPRDGVKTTDIVGSATYDAGPRLSAFSVPATLAQGAPGIFSVAASDPFSPITAITWSFGDGSTAAGASVAHAYATPGSQSATVTATNAGGLSSSLTAATAVAAGALGERPAVHAGLRATVKIATKRLHELLERGLKLKVGCTQVCRVAIKIEIPGKLARQLRIGAHVAARHRKLAPVVIAIETFKLKSAEDRTITVKLARKIRKRLARVHTLKLIAAVRASNAGQSASASKTTTLR